MGTLLYNPDRKDKKDLISEFVVRTELFDQIFDDIKSSKMKHPEQNYLLLGQRGSGKTTLITRLKYAIEDDAKLNKWLIPIVFSEEQYNISELANVWENIAIFLEDYHGFSGISEEIEKHITKKDFEAFAFDVLIKHIEKHSKKILLFIDNIGDLLAKFTELDVRRLREILQSKPQIRLIAGSSVTLESLVDYHQPLYEFFKVIQLKGLNFEESVSLLKKLAEVHKETTKINKIIKDSPSRIETLRTLSGGVPRTIALLFQVFVDNEHGNALSDLEKVLDSVTPLYKHRMDDLPSQQQKIVDAVAKNWDAISVKELTEKLRIESKIISSQLRQLERNQVIEKRTTNTKNHIYLLKERFFNIWYLMRYGRKQDRQRVVWLVKFLEMWCDGKEIEKRILNYIDKAKQGLLDKKTLETYGEVYSYFEKVGTETKLLLKESTPKYISEQINLSNEEFDKTIEKCIQKKDWSKLMNVCINKRKLSDEQKEKIFRLWDDKSAKDIQKVLFEYYNQEKGFQKINSKSYDIPDFYGLAFLHIIVLKTPAFLEEKNNKLIQENFKMFKLTYNALKKEDKMTDFENQSLFIFIFMHIVYGYHNLAMSFFTEFLGPKESKQMKYDVPRELVTYFVNNKNRNSLQKLNPELEKLIVEMGEDITTLRKEISENLN